MGSQVRILYRPPSKAQARGVKPLVFFFDTKADTKIDSKSYKASFLSRPFLTPLHVFIKQCAFQKFCNTVLHNEACDAHKELHRHKAKEITFSDLTLEEARQLHTFDEYFKGETAFERAGKKITPKLLLEAIRTLPEEKRKAILLYYFEGMNDTEIAELFNTSRSTIQYRRTSSFEKLRKYLEENADEWDEW